MPNKEVLPIEYRVEHGDKTYAVIEYVDGERMATVARIIQGDSREVCGSVDSKRTTGRLWRDRHGAFGLEISSEQIDKILRVCSLAGDRETGGVLIGRYTNTLSLAIVSRVTGPPSDSTASVSSFVRGTKGLQKLIHRVWQRDCEYYLGEWHFHPKAAAYPSQCDRRQMTDIALSPSYRCPEPILLILGGSPSGVWSIGTFVYDAGKEVELFEMATSSILD